MIVDVLARLPRERVWNWDGTAEMAAELHAHLDTYGTSLGITTRFIDHGDGTATVENDTYMYGTSRYPVEARRWYRTYGNWGGIEPVPTTKAEVNALYVAYPEFPAAFPEAGTDEDALDDNPRPMSAG